MELQSHGKDWRSILLLVFSLSGIALAITAAISSLFMVTLNNSVVADFPEINASPLSTILAAGSLFSFGLLLIPVAWLSLQRLRGKKFTTLSLPPFRMSAWIAIPGLWVLVLILATLFYDRRGASWYLPWLHFLSIALPIYIIIRIAINRIPLGSSQRAWGVFGTGMTLGPIFSAIAEILILGIGILILAVFLGINPEKMINIERMINQIDNAPDMESLVYLFGPLINNPLSLLTALMFLSVFVPIIEEIAKSVGILLVADRITSHAQGFALGVLSGAGFALAESLFATLAPDDTWALTLSMRAVSGSMHMLASGLAGWGIAYARLEKRYYLAFGMIFLAMVLHGVWNAGAVLSVAGGLRLMLVMPEIDLLGTFLMIIGVSIIFMLIGGIFATLILSNIKLKASSQAPKSSMNIRKDSGLLSPDEQAFKGGVK